MNLFSNHPQTSFEYLQSVLLQYGPNELDHITNENDYHISGFSIEILF